MTYKALTLKENMDKLDYFKIKYCSSRHYENEKAGQRMGDYCNNSKDILYKYFLKTIKKTTTQQKNRQNWVFNKISRYPINLLKSALSFITRKIQKSEYYYANPPECYS